MTVAVEWWILRIVLEPRSNPVQGLYHPSLTGAGARATEEQCNIVYGLVADDVYIAVPGIGLCEPVEAISVAVGEGMAREKGERRLAELAAAHADERYALVMAVTV